MKTQKHMQAHADILQADLVTKGIPISITHSYEEQPQTRLPYAVKAEWKPVCFFHASFQEYTSFTR